MKLLRNLFLTFGLLLATIASAGLKNDPQVADTAPYFDPQHPGSGFQLAVWEGPNGLDSAVTWYTFADDGSPLWFIGFEKVRDDSDGVVYELYQPHGYSFKTKDYELGPSIGYVKVSRYYIFYSGPTTGPSQGFTFSWSFKDGSGYCDGFSPPMPTCSGTYETIRLTPGGPN